MSVINQMLKDLDQRQQNQGQAHSVPPPASQPKNSTVKIVVITLVCSVQISALVWFVWATYQENQTLKAELTTNLANNSTLAAAKPSNVNNTNAHAGQEHNNQALKVEQVGNTATVQVTTDEETSSKQAENLTSGQSSLQTSQSLAATNNAQADSVKNQAIKQTNYVAAEQHQHQNNSETHSHHQPAEANNSKAEELAAPTSSLTIARKQLTPDELAEQKMTQAERAVAEGKLSQAETLFEDVLLLVPSHEVARKQLAALWYGRKAYQPALNLLQQGLALDKHNYHFRLMQARIYLNLKQVAQAYQVLSAQADNQDIEYQALLANAAQQSGNYQAAITAYTKLVTLAPQSAKYWLGLAIAYDSNGQFPPAVNAYESAIIQGGLSKSALTFAKQRKDELGE